MATESPCQSKFSKLMPYHVLGDVDWDKFITIVNCNCMTYKVRRNH